MNITIDDQPIINSTPSVNRALNYLDNLQDGLLYSIEKLSEKTGVHLPTLRVNAKLKEFDLYRSRCRNKYVYGNKNTIIEYNKMINQYE